VHRGITARAVAQAELDGKLPASSAEVEIR